MYRPPKTPGVRTNMEATYAQIQKKPSAAAAAATASSQPQYPEAAGGQDYNMQQQGQGYSQQQIDGNYQGGLIR